MPKMKVQIPHSSSIEKTPNKSTSTAPSLNGPLDTALIAASIAGHRDEVIRLHIEGANLDSTDEDGYNPLLHTIVRGDERLVGYLLNNGANPSQLYPNDRTALHIAAARGQLWFVQLLIDKGAYLDARMEGGRTPLHLAAERGYKQTVRILMWSGANKYMTDENGKTPGELADEAGWDETAEMF